MHDNMGFKIRCDFRNEKMENHVLVRTRHLNHKGNLFGGQMLLWVDECGNKVHVNK